MLKTLWPLCFIVITLIYKTNSAKHSESKVIMIPIKLSLSGIVVIFIGLEGMHCGDMHVLCVIYIANLLSIDEFLVYRALFIAVHFHGKQMQQDTVVWHGLSEKMVFENFASLSLFCHHAFEYPSISALLCHVHFHRFYFDSPTSTTVDKRVAQAFTLQGEGIILQLKSKYNTNCATMLDVSRFSDYPEGMQIHFELHRNFSISIMFLRDDTEQERLFLSETLIITDVLKVDPDESVWHSHSKHLKAILFFEKITTGNAAEERWNILESEMVMKQLVDLIEDHFSKERDPDQEEYPNRTPRYILDLFGTYLRKQQMPRFDNIDVIWEKLLCALQDFFCDDNVQSSEFSRLSQERVQRLFPNALNYTDERGYMKSL